MSERITFKIILCAMLSIVASYPAQAQRDSRRPAEVTSTETPEQSIPTTGYRDGRDWETCMTINDTWGYKSTDTNYKSTETLIRNLIDIASKGGNYLLNIGPTTEGMIPQPLQRIPSRR